MMDFNMVCNMACSPYLVETSMNQLSTAFADQRDMLRCRNPEGFQHGLKCGVQKTFSNLSIKIDQYDLPLRLFHVSLHLRMFLVQK